MNTSTVPAPSSLTRGACRGEDPELFFPIGTTGPAALQIHNAKAVCLRCPVMDECLQWAVQSGQDAGVWGGQTEDERRSMKRRTARDRAREAASRRSEPNPEACGTDAGYRTHLEHGEQACDRCKAAHATAAREHTARRAA